MTAPAFSFVPHKPHFYDAVLSATVHESFHKGRLSGDLVRLAPFIRFYYFHQRLNE